MGPLNCVPAADTEGLALNAHCRTGPPGVAALIAGAPLAHWRARLDAVECCFEAVHEVADVAGHPQVLARGFVRTQLGPEALVEVLFPARIDGAPPRGRGALAFVTPEDAVGAWG